MVYDITRLVAKQRYAIHVRAYYDDGKGLIRLGAAIEEVSIMLNGQLSTITAEDIVPPTIGSNTVVFHLPSVILIHDDDLIKMT